MSGPKIPARVRNLTGDPVQDRIDASRDELADLLRRCPFFFGRIVSVNFTAATPKLVTHRLGTPAACFVVRQDYGGAAAYPALIEAPLTTALGDESHQLGLLCEATCTLDLWFYPRASRPIDANTGQSR